MTDITAYSVKPREKRTELPLKAPKTACFLISATPSDKNPEENKMYELIKVTDICYYVQCPAKIGIVRLSDSEVFLVDSGNDKDTAKKVLKILDSNGWTLKFIVNTHSHADHTGGNRFFLANLFRSA